MNSLCQKALHIVTELCFAGQVEWEKCSGIFPRDRGSQGGGSTGNRGEEGPARVLALPSGLPVQCLPRRAGGSFRAQRLPTLLLPPTRQLATWTVGFSCVVSPSPPAWLLPLLRSARARRLAPRLLRPLAAHSHARVFLRERSGRRGLRRGDRSPGGLGLPDLAPWRGRGEGAWRPCLEAGMCFAPGAALASEGREDLGKGNSKLQPVEHLIVSKALSYIYDFPGLRVNVGKAAGIIDRPSGHIQSECKRGRKVINHFLAHALLHTPTYRHLPTPLGNLEINGVG